MSGEMKQDVDPMYIIATTLAFVGGPVAVLGYMMSVGGQTVAIANLVATVLIVVVRYKHATK